MLRDLLCRLPGAGTWPCDEIGAIWRHGNAGHPTDELGPELATDDVRHFVRRAFEKLARRRGLELVVEKTCANSLRVPFVREIFPEARFIFVVRDGRDAVASAIERWNAPLDLRYTLRKARFVPASDVPRYLLGFVENRLQKLTVGQARHPTWGPRFEGMDAVLREQGIAAACAWQWIRCVESASAALRDLGPDRVARVRYAELVSRPAGELRRLAAFLELELDKARARELTSHVSAASIGTWEARLSPSQREVVEGLLQPRLHSLLEPEPPPRGTATHGST
jgi:hypothetical protein